MAGWNLWHGCRKVSEGCRRCYVYRQDARWEQDASQVRRTAAFDLPVRRDRTGRYKIPPGQTVYTCFTSDFFIEEADAWRGEAWAMIRERSDCTFLMITKRIDRVADYRLPIYLSLPLCRREVICEPLLERLDLSRYLAEGRIDSVSCGGESGDDARVCDFDWVLDLRRQCVDAGVAFRFRQTGARLRKEGRIYRIRRQFQHSQARRAGVDFIVEG